MNIRQIAVVLAALLVAVVVLVIVRGMAAPAPQPAVAAPAPVAGVPVLTASRALALGEAAAAGDFVWTQFPESSVGEGYITQTALPNAIEQFTGAVARQPIAKGEPIFGDRLVARGERGFMAAILEPGYRAISVPIRQETAAAGFILPNDRVDVILTANVSVKTGDGSVSVVRSDVVLEDVRVLAIDQSFRPENPEGETPAAVTGVVATLELSPADAETLAMAGKLGDITLALRGVRQQEDKSAKVASATKLGAPALQQNAAERLVTLHAGGKIEVANLEQN